MITGYMCCLFLNNCLEVFHLKLKCNTTDKLHVLIKVLHSTLSMWKSNLPHQKPAVLSFDQDSATHYSVNCSFPSTKWSETTRLILLISGSFGTVGGGRELCKIQFYQISQTVATRCQILRLKCTKFDFCWCSITD